MALYYEADGVTLLLGDCRQVMRELPAESVSCIVTSPPFWGLRKYECPDSVWADGWRGQLGLEPTVQLYIEHTMAWIREVKRVLRKDGVFWLDIGDSRGGSGKGQMGDGSQGRAGSKQATNEGSVTGGLPIGQGAKPKSLCLIPQRIAIACQDAGWIVRSQIIIPSWMPESAKDRPTDSYRTVLMLVRSPRYWYDAQAVRQPLAESSIARISQPGLDGQRGGDKQQAYEGSGNANRAADMVRSLVDNGGTKNLPDIWDIPPAAYPDAHFATFCVEEPERCIRASCPEAICVKCGKPRVRMVKHQPSGRDTHCPKDAALIEAGIHGANSRLHGPDWRNQEPGTDDTLGWTDCGCNAGWTPGLVLDPFIGTGTTAIAARKLGRRCIGIDASEDYLKQAVARLAVGDSGIRRMVAARRAGAEQGVMF